MLFVQPFFFNLFSPANFTADLAIHIAVLPVILWADPGTHCAGAAVWDEQAAFSKEGGVGSWQKKNMYNNNPQKAPHQPGQVISRPSAWSVTFSGNTRYSQLSF